MYTRWRLDHSSLHRLVVTKEHCMHSSPPYTHTPPSSGDWQDPGRRVNMQVPGRVATLKMAQALQLSPKETSNPVPPPSPTLLPASGYTSSTPIHRSLSLRASMSPMYRVHPHHVCCTWCTLLHNKTTNIIIVTLLDTNLMMQYTVVRHAAGAQQSDMQLV